MSLGDFPNEIIWIIAENLNEDSLCFLIESGKSFLFLQKLLKYRRKLLYHSRMILDGEVKNPIVLHLRKLDGIYLRRTLIDEISITTNERIMSPFHMWYSSKGSLRLEIWSHKRRSEDKSFYISYYPSGIIKYKSWEVRGKPFRKKGPNEICYHENGSVKSFS